MAHLDRRMLLKAVAGAAALPLAAGTARAASSARKVEEADVIILGAGLSGLNAALLLEEQGKKVIVLEGQNRAGGRLYTLDDVPGHPEGGGSGIGKGYARIIDMAGKLKLDLVEVGERQAGMAKPLIHIRGQNIRAEDWAVHAANPFTGPGKQAFPWTLGAMEVAKANKLADVEAWLKPESASFDVPYAEFLRERGLSDEAIDLVASTNSGYAAHGWDISVLMLMQIATWIKQQRAAGPGQFAVKGGNMRLPEAMAARVKSGVRYGKIAAGIRSDAQAAEILCTDGALYRGKYVICTVPFSALRTIPIEPVLTGRQAEAVVSLTYNQVYQVHFVPAAAYWDQDGWNPNMWTDTAAARFIHLTGAGSHGTLFAFVSGNQALALDRLAPDAAAQKVLAAVERIRPAAKGKLKAVRTLSWQRNPFAGGSYATWSPGQISRFANVMAEPAGPGRRLHLAGEHTARIDRGMEGAMESGERAALAVLEAG